jgi:hypothetical protein
MGNNPIFLIKFFFYKKIKIPKCIIIFIFYDFFTSFNLFFFIVIEKILLKYFLHKNLDKNYKLKNLIKIN